MFKQTVINIKSDCIDEIICLQAVFIYKIDMI